VDVISDEQASAGVTDLFNESNVSLSGTLSPSGVPGIERPRSPWGSYEVMNQSGSKTPLEEPEAVEEVVEVPASFITDEPASENTVQKQDAENATTATVDDSKLTVDTTNTELPERPKSPWTPSYSVRRQGSDVFTKTKDDSEPAEVEEMPSGAESFAKDAPTNEVVPVPELVVQVTSVKATEPAQATTEVFPSTQDSDDPGSLTSLDTIGELTVAKDRKRLESTASSLFFPGGWFSKPPAGRASLDNVQGEIISPKATAPVNELPSPGQESDSAPDSATVEDDKEKKGKWCVIM
jgi:hypothetical protein